MIMTRVAVLGLGAMGSRMAAALLQGGYDVSVWNRTPAKAQMLVNAGATAAATPAAAVANADFAIAMVRDDAASRHVWLDPNTGALAALRAGAIAIDSSTLSPDWARELAAQAARRKLPFLDAPVAGSRPQADARQLVYFIGGDAGDVQRAAPVLEQMGAAVHHVGSAGSGATMKLVVNALFGVQVAAIAELLGLLRRSGLDPTKAIEILATTPVCSPAAKVAAGSMLARNFAPMFPIDLVEKDFGYLLSAGANVSAELPLSRATREVFALAVDQHRGADNITGVAQLYE